MAKFKIRYTWDAVNDLDSIFDYISEEKKDAAARMLVKIEKAILSLSENPRIGTVISADDLVLINSGYRKIIVKPYIIFYRIGDGQIYISRVLHSKQDWIHLLFKSEF